MRKTKTRPPYLLGPLSVYFLTGLVVVNFVALFTFNPFYIGSFLSFLYIVVTPGFLLLPLLTKQKFPAPLGITLSVALSILLLMFMGLALNTVLPLFGMLEPLSTFPLLISFDILVYFLLVLNYEYKEDSAFEFHGFGGTNSILAGVSLALPVFACLEAVVINNGGSNFYGMLTLGLIALLVPAVLFSKNASNSSLPPLVIYFMALALLLMNSMRGWFVTGHDILLEYHVFALTNTAHLWNMASYQDPYMACLSLTILPTFFQSLIHVDPAYIFKFFTQFIGALPAVGVYYLAKEYTSEKFAFLAAFLYISFPTFVVDMAFLNRQGIAFLFFGLMVFFLLTRDYITGWRRHLVLIALGIGMIISHYSTSYVAVPLLLFAYIVNKVLRILMTSQRPLWFAKLTGRVGNIEMYRKPVLITFPFVIALLVLMLLWSSVITKTSSGLFKTVGQIATTMTHPFSNADYVGPAKYSFFQSQQRTPTQLFNTFKTTTVNNARTPENETNLYPLNIAKQYPAFPIAPVTEPLIPYTAVGLQLQSVPSIHLADFYVQFKQYYAKALQLLLLLGFVGLGLGYVFRGSVLRQLPIEFTAFSIAGIIIMVGQTLLPSSDIDYGLLRLFQQNLVFLALPITLGMFAVISLVFHKHFTKLAVLAGILTICFLVLSGFVPQITGGGRPALPLNNYGFYYDTYYTHTQEISAINWLARNNVRFPIQSDHYFSSVKILSYANEGTLTGLLSESIQKNSFVYLNYLNVTTSTVIEFVNNDIFYYHLSTAFLEKEKNLVYDNGGSKIYR